MKLEDKFEIRDFANSGLSCDTIGKPRLIDKPISGLISALKEAGVNIDEEESKVVHQRDYLSEKGEIPLNFYLGAKPDIQRTINIIGYNLKGDNLEIILNYKSKSDAPKEFTIHTRIGPSHIETNLICTLRLTGEYKNTEIIEKIKGKIDDFYAGLNLPKKDLEKLRKDMKGVLDGMKKKVKKSILPL